jgi:hypothetical protein
LRKKSRPEEAKMSCLAGSENDNRPTFIVTVDTEGDNLWAKLKAITTRNARFLPRFQSLCESYGLFPVYLTNYEMATCKEFQEFGHDIIRRGAGEIGMHLHAWNSPPVFPLTPDDFRHHPYLIEYPTKVMQDKIAFMTGLLEDTFGVKMVSHRAGRFSFNETYADLLVKHGYQVDCSVTPRVSWRTTPGNPAQHGGTDFLEFPDNPYFVNLGKISEPGDSVLLEVPVSIIIRSLLFIPTVVGKFPRMPTLRRVLRRLLGRALWLKPSGTNRNELLYIVQSAVTKGKPHLEFMLHSSELMPGGSPGFPTERHIEKLYEDLNALFSLAQKTCSPSTLKEYYNRLFSLKDVEVDRP